MILHVEWDELIHMHEDLLFPVVRVSSTKSSDTLPILSWWRDWSHHLKRLLRCRLVSKSLHDLAHAGFPQIQVWFFPLILPGCVECSVIRTPAWLLTTFVLNKVLGLKIAVWIPRTTNLPLKTVFFYIKTNAHSVLPSDHRRLRVHLVMVFGCQSVVVSLLRVVLSDCTQSCCLASSHRFLRRRIVYYL